jgi:hypothetical protein
LLRWDGLHFEFFSFLFQFAFCIGGLQLHSFSALQPYLRKEIAIANVLKGQLRSLRRLIGLGGSADAEYGCSPVGASYLHNLWIRGFKFPDDIFTGWECRISYVKAERDIGLYCYIPQLRSD